MLSRIPSALRPKKRVYAIVSFCALLLATSPLAQAKPASQSSSTNTYEQAKKELPKDFYQLYRIVERLARANGLDEHPWRIKIESNYIINAYATDANLIAMYSGLLDQLEGDVSALACVVGHEMGHSVKRHIAVSEVQKAALLEQISKEAEEEVSREANSATTEATATSVAGGILGGIFRGSIGSIGGSVLQGASNRRIQAGRERIQEITKKKQMELEQRLAEADRQQEFEADEVGYLYSAKAGFDADGCLRAMEVLARTKGAEFDTNHPAVPKRIEALKQLMVKYSSSTLMAEGKKSITATKPLTYDLSRDGESLRVNSRFKSSPNSDLERVLGR